MIVKTGEVLIIYLAEVGRPKRNIKTWDVLMRCQLSDQIRSLFFLAFAFLALI